MKHFGTCILILILVSCNQRTRDGISADSNYKIIDVESSVGKGRVVDLAEIAVDIDYIPLETNRISAIGSSPFIYYENERFYFLFSRIVKVFDKTGKYLFTFDRRGGGPEEYPASGFPQIERGTGNFRIQYMKGDDIVIKTYSPNGAFLKVQNMRRPENRDVSKAIQLSSALYLSKVSPEIERNGKKYCAVLFDTLSNIKGYIPNPVVNSDYKTQEVNMGKVGARRINMINIKIIPYFHSFKDLPRIYTFLGDTIYTFSKEKGLIPEYALNYGKYLDEKVNLSSIKSTSGQFINIDNYFFIESDNFLLLDFLLRDFAHEPFTGKRFVFDRMRERRDAYGLYNKKSGEFTLLNHPVKNKPGFRDNINQGPPFIPQYVSDSNYAVNFYFPYELIDYVANNDVSPVFGKMVSSLKETDNPVVVLVKLKH